MRLSFKISLLLVAASLIPSVLVLGFSLWSIEDNRRQALLERVQHSVELSASHLSDQYLSARREVELYANLPMFKQMDMQRALPFLKDEIKRHNGRYEKFIVGTLEGHFYNTKGGNPAQNYLRTFDDTEADSPPKNIRKRDYWQATVGSNKSAVSNSFVSNPMISYTTGARQIVIAASIVDDKKDLQGMVGVSVDWATVTGLIEKIRGTYFSSFSWQPKMMLLSGDGTYWYHWDESKVVSLQRDEDGALELNADGQVISKSYTLADEGIEELLYAKQLLAEKKSGVVSYYDKKDGLDYYFFYAPITSTEYGIGLLISKKELLTLSLDMFRIAGMLLLSVTLILIVAQLWHKRNLTNPLQKLAMHLRELGKGAYSKSIKLKTGDELEDIACTLNDMSSAVLSREEKILEINQNLETRVEERTKDLEVVNQRLKQLSLHDDLTGIGNRRAMKNCLDNVHAQFLRGKPAYTAVMLDIDFFKQYNDFYGHADGDAVLRSVAESLQASIRNVDFVYRYGGEEFVIVLPETDPKLAKLVVARSLQDVCALNIPHEKSSFEKITISAGYKTIENNKQLWESILKEADDALYTAKAQGRNQAAAA